jgi:hypothetical protein
MQKEKLFGMFCYHYKNNPILSEKHHDGFAFGYMVFNKLTPCANIEITDFNLLAINPNIINKTASSKLRKMYDFLDGFLINPEFGIMELPDRGTLLGRCARTIDETVFEYDEHGIPTKTHDIIVPGNSLSEVSLLCEIFKPGSARFNIKCRDIKASLIGLPWNSSLILEDADYWKDYWEIVAGDVAGEKLWDNIFKNVSNPFLNLIINAMVYYYQRDHDSDYFTHGYSELLEFVNKNSLMFQ